MKPYLLHDKDKIIDTNSSKRKDGELKKSNINLKIVVSACSLLGRTYQKTNINNGFKTMSRETL